MQQRLRHVLLLAFLLVFVQQVMATHAISHVKADTAKHLSSNGGDEPNCPECLVLGGLGFSGPAQGLPDFSTIQDVDRVVLPVTPWLALRRVAAHAIRAPPFSV